MLFMTGFSCTLFKKTNNAEDTSNNNSNIDSTKSKRPMTGQDSFGLAVCDEVSKSLVSEAIAKEIVETEDWSSSTDTGCKYYTNKEKLQYVLINVTYLSAENQKKGQELMGRTITTDSAIAIENFIAMQPDGNINAIYLVMAPEKYSRIDRTDPNITNEMLIDISQKVANIILYNNPDN